jgi:hypothetical protein
MPDYSKGKVYTIRCKTDNTLIYVGSTTQTLAKRCGEHKLHSRSEKRQNNLLYKTINNNWEDWYIELFEECPCENKEQLNRREGEIIRLIGNLNSRIEGRTKQEYYQDNREKIIEAVKEYSINNKEARKEYRQNHQEEINERRKIYYEEHKEEISAKRIAYYHEVQCKDKEYIRMKNRENYAKRQAKKKDIEALNPA